MTYSKRKKIESQDEECGLWDLSVRSRGWLRSSAPTRHPRLLSRELELVKSQRNSLQPKIFFRHVCFPFQTTLSNLEDTFDITRSISIFSRRTDISISECYRCKPHQQVQRSSFVYPFLFFSFPSTHSKSVLSALVYPHREAGV